MILIYNYINLQMMILLLKNLKNLITRRYVIVYVGIYVFIITTLYFSERKGRQTNNLILGLTNYFGNQQEDYLTGVCSIHQQTDFIRNSKKNEYNNFKKIVIWTDYFKKPNLWGKVFQRHCLNECEETRCIFTTDRRNIEKADAVLFDGNTLDRTDYHRWEEKFKFPGKREPNQIYVFFSTEPPTRYSNIKLEKFENFFNWTMTYRRDSDVVVPYGTIIKRKLKVEDITQDELRRKKTSIWLNSHCMDSPRNKFITSLSRYLDVDIFGVCVNKKCGERAVLRFATSIGNDSCEKSFVNYTFFMALENSLCKDYVTEKLYRSLKLGIIPVVFGAVNYTEFAPPKSFIDAKDFKNEFDLSIYLKKVASNVTLYNEYFKWKKNYEIDVGTPYMPLICDLCKNLHSKSRKMSPKSYSSIYDWYIRKGNCVDHLSKNIS